MVKPVRDPELEFDTERDLDDVWADMLVQYAAITDDPTLSPEGEERRQQSHEALVAQVLRDVEASRSANKSYAKEILLKTGGLLQKLGGVLASAASIAFGPADHCYNAISFVVNAGKEYSKVIDGYITLLEHCATFLARIVHHLERARAEGEARLPPHLRRSAYKGLSIFLTVQAHCRNHARSKRTKAKLFCAVVLFSDDDDVKSNLEKLTRVSFDLTGETADEILGDVKGLARWIQATDVERQRHEEECRRHFEAIKDIKDSIDHVAKTTETTGMLVGQLKANKDSEENVRKIADALHLRESDRKWEGQHKAVRKLAGTGKWMLASDEFKLWAKLKNEHKLIMLEGNEGSGKTYLCSHVLDYLTDYANRAANEHVFVAYYFYEKGASADDCISALVYQLARSNEAYAAQAASKCPDAGFFSSASKIWETLVVGLADSLKDHYFLVIDGYPGDKEGTMMKDLINRTIVSGNISMNLFLSGRHEDLIGLSDKCPIFSLGVSDLSWDDDERAPSPKNNDDLLLYTKHRINKLCEENGDFRGILNDPERDIATEFVRGTRGDFAKLVHKLDEVSEAQNPSTLEKLIGRAGESDQESFDRVLLGLYDTLSPEDIKELNILLPWIYYGGDLSQKLLRTVVQWKTGQVCWLETHIRTKFKALLKLDERNMVSAAFGEDHVRVATSDVSNISIKSIQATDVALRIARVQKCEVDLVQHFVKAYCTDDLYKRFQFDDFFREKSSGSLERIQLDSEYHIEASILQTCLEALADNTTDTDFEPLRGYASYRLDEHLLALKPYEIGKTELLRLGELFSAILWDDEAIDAWWSWDYAYDLRSWWLGDYNNNILKKLVELLKHPHVKAAYSSDSERSQGILAMMSGIENESQILRQVAKRLASRWLRAVDLDMRYLLCSYDIWAKIQLDKNSKDSYLWATTSIEEVEKFMEFAQDASAVSVDKLQLETRKAVALWANGYIKEAVDVCSISQLESGADRHWPLLLLRAVIHVGAKEYTNALECIRTMMDTNELSKTANAEFTKVYWNRLLLLKGQCHQSLSQVDEAARCYLKLLQHGGDDNEQMSVCRNALVQLLQTWTESENYLLIVDHIKQWKTDRFDNSKESSLYWFRMALSMPNFHPYVLLAIARTNTHEVISALYKNTNERLTKNKSEGDNKILAETLCFYRACILLYCSTSDQEQKSGLKMLMEMILSAQDGDYDRYSPKLIAVTHVTRTLLNRGIVLQRQVETASEEHQQNVEKGRKEVLKQLRHIATFHSDMLKACRRTPYRDPRLALARLELKVGHEVEFRRIIKDLLHKQFDHWPEPEELWAISDRLGKVAVILGATDEDQDTIAAWQLTNLPNFKEPTTSASSTSTLEKISTEDEAEGTKADLLDAQVMAGSQPTNSDAAASMGTSAAANVTVNPDESVPDPTTSTDSETSSDLVFGSEPNFSCDGCGVVWAVMEDFYACKHCAVTQLCAPCHVKLLARQLPPTTCNPHHEFVHVPPFDRPAWAALGPGNMLYGGKVVSQVAWLEQLRTRWALRQDQIDARRDRLRKLLAKMLQVYVTSVAIVKFWRRYKRERYEDEEFQRIALVDGVYTWVT